MAFSSHTLSKRFTKCLYCKSIVVEDVLKYSLEYGDLEHDFLCEYYQSGSDMLIHVAPSSVLSFHEDKIGILTLLL